jgi:hypothetical protein
MPAPASAPALAHLHAAFLSILPRIDLHTRVYFRGVRCPQRRDDAIQETLAIAWKWFLRLVEQGKDPRTFPDAFASYAARAVKCGRRLCGHEKGKGALSVIAQQRHGCFVEPLPHSTAATHEERYSHGRGQQRQDAFKERLRDNVQTPAPEQVCFRLDFPAWLTTLTGRERRLVREMANNECVRHLSNRFDQPGSTIFHAGTNVHGGTFTAFSMGAVIDSGRGIPFPAGRISQATRAA